jgi:hypothetical protein
MSHRDGVICQIGAVALLSLAAASLAEIPNVRVSVLAVTAAP